MSTPKQAQQAWEALGEQAMKDMHVLFHLLDLAVAKARKDGLPDWAIRQALEHVANRMLPETCLACRQELDRCSCEFVGQEA